MSNCEHKFVLGGHVFVDDSRPLPGTGACARTYYRFFFCEKCLDKRHERLYPSHEKNTYQKPEYDATPESLRNIKETRS